MKTIIIPTDFSPVATNALHYAIDMAKAMDASLLLFHAYQIPVSYTDTPLILVSVDELKKNADDRLENLKTEAEQIASGKIKIYTEAKLGDTRDELEALCDKIQPFAVVMGTRGSSGLEHVIFGSTTLSAIRHLKWPVISVPPNKKFGNGIKKIGFACDLKEVIKTTPAGAIKDVVTTLGAELHVLNVHKHNNDLKPEATEEAALLQTMLQEVNPVYHFIEHKDIEDGISEFADNNNLDLLITIPKKHKLLEGLFRTSSTKQLVFQSHVPVMCIHE